MLDAEWEPFKPDIERLYCNENKTLIYVLEYMERLYDFKKSKQQYQRQLKKWGFSKNQVRQRDWRNIVRRVEKRRTKDKKRSEVHFRGVQRNVERAEYRDGYVSTIDKFAAPSPSTPEDVIVCTPVSPGMRLEWNTSLPWLRFFKLVKPEIIQAATSPSTSLTVPSPRDLGLPPRTISRELMQRLASILPWAKLNNSQNIYSGSRTATALTILMPEASKGQHLDLSSCLSYSKQKGRDCLILELFLLSNNFVSHAPGNRTEESMSSDDERVLEMFKQSGWNNVNHLQMLLSTHEPTAYAIAEKLFASAIRLLDLDTVKTMLEAGIDADAIIDTIPDGPISSLQFAVLHETPELMQLLLSHGANVNLLHDGYSALDFAAREQNKLEVQMLLAKGA